MLLAIKGNIKNIYRLTKNEVKLVKKIFKWNK